MNADPKECLKRYRDFRPTGCDAKGLGLEDRQDWFVAPCSRTRDSGVLAESNFTVLRRELEREQAEHGSSFTEEHDYEVHRFGHWGPGWFEIILVRPGSLCAQVAAELACALSDYPILDDEHHAQLEQEEADRIWKECYSVPQRLEYIRENREQFNFHSLADMIGCARGKFFCGPASELVQDSGW